MAFMCLEEPFIRPDPFPAAGTGPMRELAAADACRVSGGAFSVPAGVVVVISTWVCAQQAG